MPDSLDAAREIISRELASLQAQRDRISTRIAHLEKTLAVMAEEIPDKPATITLDALPTGGYGALTKAVRVLLERGASLRDMTSTLAAKGFVKDPSDPTPVRTVIKGLRKRGTPVAYDPGSQLYSLAK